MSESEDLEKRRMEGGPGRTGVYVCICFDEVSSVNLIIAFCEVMCGHNQS